MKNFNHQPLFLHSRASFSYYRLINLLQNCEKHFKQDKPPVHDVNRWLFEPQVIFYNQKYALYEVSARQVRCLPPTSFRFQLTMDTLAFGYVIPAIRAYSGLAPVRQCSCRAYKKTRHRKSFRAPRITENLFFQCVVFRFGESPSRAVVFCLFYFVFVSRRFPDIRIVYRLVICALTFFPC